MAIVEKFRKERIVGEENEDREWRERTAHGSCRKRGLPGTDRTGPDFEAGIKGDGPTAC